MNEETDKKFIADLQTQLEQSENNIDGSTRSKLTQARYTALEKCDQANTKSWKLPAFAAATFASLILSLAVFLNFNNNKTANDYLMSEYEYTAYIDSSDPIFGNYTYNYEDENEFYQWLDNLEES